MEPSSDSAGLSVSLEETVSQVAYFCRENTRGCCLVQSGGPGRLTDFVAGLQDSLDRPLASLSLPPLVAPRQLVGWLGDQVTGLAEGTVVVVGGWEGLGPPGAGLDEFFSAANYYRESLLGRPLIQVWWMSESYRSSFRRKAPDAYSWFTLIVEVAAEPVARGVADWSARDTAGAPRRDPFTARQTAEWLEKRAVLLLGESGGKGEKLVEAIQIYADAGVALAEAGLVVESEALLRRATDAVDSSSPHSGLLEALRQGDPRGEVRVRAKGLYSLSDWLRLVGRSGSRRRLEEALEAGKEALALYSRESFPVDWARTQGNLGNVLQVLGEREEGTARLEESVSAYRAALEVYTRESFPVDWAMTQNNLGIVLQVLGAREEGTARLEESVFGYRAALEVRTRESFPVDWAMTQNNLGNVLQVLGGREEGTARLEESVFAYRAALEVHTLASFPVEWAMTQNNLGAVLGVLGEREEGTARLEESVSAYRAAMEVHTRASFPVEWALTQNNLGIVLEVLGGREEGTARLEEAVSAFRAALEVRTPEAMPYQHRRTMGNLQGALRLLQARQGSA